MRQFSTLGWFALEMVGALELDRTANPVMQAWALDAVEPFEGGSGKSETHRRMMQLINKIKDGRPIDENPQAVLDRSRKARCDQCGNMVPARELEDIHGCCDECYWSMGD